MQNLDKHPNASRYEFCPKCRELWLIELLARLNIRTCPLCDTPVTAVPGRPRIIPTDGWAAAGADAA